MVNEEAPEDSSDMKARKGRAAGSKENGAQGKKLLPQKVQDEIRRSSTPERKIETNLQNLLRNEEYGLRKQEPEKSPREVEGRKEFLKLKAEVELAKLNEDSLKNELDVSVLY